MVKRVTIDLDLETLKQADEERKKKQLSRNLLINYLLRKWIKDGCKIIME